MAAAEVVPVAKQNREGYSLRYRPSTCQNPAASSSHSFPPSGNFQTASLALQLHVLDGSRRAGPNPGEGRSRSTVHHSSTRVAKSRVPELKRFYRRKLVQKGMGKARVATARKLGIRLWIMLRDEIDYEEFCRRGKLPQKGKTHAGMPDFNSGPARAVTGSTE